MELAFVEVSSDGVNFFRFDAVSAAPTDVQLTNFSFLRLRLCSEPCWKVPTELWNSF